VGLALGGGAARGLAHVGVLRALGRLGIPVHAVGGASIGALVGGLFAATGDVGETEARLRGFLGSTDFARMRLRFLREDGRPSAARFFYSFSSLLKKGIVLGYSMAKPSFVPAEEFARHIRALLPDIPIEAARIPLVVVAADLNTGREVDLRAGPLRDAVSGSCAIPGVLPPWRLDGLLLVDGGWVNKVPVRPVRDLGADVVVAVDVSQELDDTVRLRSGLNILTRATAILSNRLAELQAADADLLIRPRVQGIHWADFSRLDDAIGVGEEAVEAVRDELLALTRRRSPLRLRRWRRR
jgi:NTE family protein